MAISNKWSLSYKNVLVARFSALGDVAMTIPVVYSVCIDNPETRFVMVTQKMASTLFINVPANLVVLGIDTKNEYKGLAGIRKLKDKLIKEYEIDLFIDLHDVLRTWLLGVSFLASGVKVMRFDKGRRGKHVLTRRHNKRMLPLLSSRARYREVFHRAGFSFSESFVSIFGDSKAPAELYSSIIEPKRKGETWIAIAPFAKHKGKIYPLDLMEKVVYELSSWEHTTVFLLGAGKNEEEILSRWQKHGANIINMAAHHSGFACELSLLSNCDVMVSMDSANMHLASLVRLQVVSVWGATHPYCGFMGWHQDERNAVQLNMSCRPCSVFGSKPCYRGDYFCMTGIPPQLIVSHVKQFLEEHGKNIQREVLDQKKRNAHFGRVTPDEVKSLKDNEIFVFGSNIGGIHGGGAAKVARLKFGAIQGQGVGLQGQSYAIPTMQGGVETVAPYVNEFIKFAAAHENLHFLVTRIGCGIAGFEDSEIAPLFARAVSLPNVSLPESFWKVLDACK